jgi:DNA-binding LacI/PurR family transcriptional regulator
MRASRTSTAAAAPARPRAAPATWPRWSGTGWGRTCRVIPGSYTDDGGRHGVAALLESGEPPTAIFVANDLAALGAMSVLAERGLRVPEDVSLVGYDNTSLAAVRQISLTTVDQPRPQMGRQAVTLVLERLTQERAAARHILIPPTLVVRGTTAPPAGA